MSKLSMLSLGLCCTAMILNAYADRVAGVIAMGFCMIMVIMANK